MVRRGGAMRCKGGKGWYEWPKGGNAGIKGDAMRVPTEIEEDEGGLDVVLVAAGRVV